MCGAPVFVFLDAPDTLSVLTDRIISTSQENKLSRHPALQPGSNWLRVGPCTPPCPRLSAGVRRMCSSSWGQRGFQPPSPSSQALPSTLHTQGHGRRPLSSSSKCGKDTVSSQRVTQPGNRTDRWPISAECGLWRAYRSSVLKQAGESCVIISVCTLHFPTQTTSQVPHFGKHLGSSRGCGAVSQRVNGEAGPRGEAPAPREG